MTELNVYLWLMLDNIKNLWVLPMVGVVASLCFMMPAVYMSPKDDEEVCVWVWKHYTYPLIIMFIVFLLATFFVPNSKQYAIMKILPATANSELSQQIQKDVPEMYTMAKDYLKELMDLDEEKSD